MDDLQTEMWTDIPDIGGTAQWYILHVGKKLPALRDVKVRHFHSAQRHSCLCPLCAAEQSIPARMQAAWKEGGRQMRHSSHPLKFGSL
jgi:hypothetical protein